MERKNPATTVDVAVFALHREEPEILLIERKYDPFKGGWALPGGFIDIGEPFAVAARRELEEETGLSGLFLAPLGIYDRPDRDPRGRTISMAFWTFAPQRTKAKAGSDASLAKWFPVRNLPPLAFDHDEIIGNALQHLKFLHRISGPLLESAKALKVEQLEKLLKKL